MKKYGSLAPSGVAEAPWRKIGDDVAYAQQEIRTRPGGTVVDPATLAECVEVCFDCVEACTAYVEACLDEDGLSARAHRVMLGLDCAYVCGVTGDVLSRRTATFDRATARAVLESCTRACALCAEGFETGAERGVGYHRACAEACRRCEKFCNAILSNL